MRARLAMQATAPLAVDERSQQFVFDQDSAAYAEIAVRRGEHFALVVVTGSLPSEQFIVDVWHRHVGEVWLIDPREELVFVARIGQPPEALGRDATLRSPALPGVAIPVDALFAPPS
ncbi:MAG TPA: hypothetical protein VFT22_33655 [Kofleriaceae bacterium]|nr:hypothetical protein [Kofleriaceae bacterium]